LSPSGAPLRGPRPRRASLRMPPVTAGLTRAADRADIRPFPIRPDDLAPHLNHERSMRELLFLHLGAERLPRLAALLEDASIERPEDSVWLKPIIQDLKQEYVRTTEWEFARRESAARWAALTPPLQARLTDALAATPELQALRVYGWSDRVVS